MANLKQSKKRFKQDLKKSKRNRSKNKSILTFIKKFLKLIQEKKSDLANSFFSIVVSKIDKGVSFGLLKKNKASRIKSRLNKKLKAIKGM